MIYFNFNIRNPYWTHRFRNIKVWHGKTPFKNKVWEIEILKMDNLLRIQFDFVIRQDHAGLGLELGLFGYEIHFMLYDNRHWDIEKNCWETY